MSCISTLNQTDLRNLSNAAKTLSELEKLLQNPRLLEIKLVSDCVTNIKLFGKNIRILAQDRLLTAITDKNQASIASSLQVFFNLESLPEIILLVIDSTVKRTVDASRTALDIEGISAMLHHDAVGGGAGGVGAGALGGGGGTAGGAGAAPNSATKRPLHALTAAAANLAGGTGERVCDVY